MSKFKIMPRIALCLAAMLVGATLTVAVTAGAQGSSTTYYACLAKGILSHVGTTVPGCSTGAKKISWNSVGPAGTNGTNGTNGFTVNTCTSLPGPGLNFSTCDLGTVPVAWSFVDLDGTLLNDANLTSAILTSANLTDANLTDANLTDANLLNANLTGATNLASAQLTGVDWTATTCPDGTSSVLDGSTCINNLTP